MSSRCRLLALALAGLALACEADDGELLLVGTVERTLIELVAPLSEMLLEVPVARGERVVAGQTVARLDPTLAHAEVARAEASLAGARTNDRVAAHELTRFRQLRRRGVASTQELERAELVRDEAAARLREAEAVLAAARKREGDLTLTTPVAGVLDQLPFEVGERVPAGAVLAVLLADAQPWVRVWIPEQRFASIPLGAPAEIRIDGVARTLEGRVLEVARQPEFTPHYALTERDRVHLVYEARVAILDAPESLRPGVPADVRILSQPALHASPAER